MTLQRRILIILFASGCLNTFGQSDTIQRIVSQRTNDPAERSKPYVILISADGLRADYLEKFQASNLIRLGQQGTRADYMLSSFPSLTFPNHYTLVTGLYPAHHGLVDNVIYDARKKASFAMSDKKAVHDSSWYGGTPVWVLAENQRMLTACFYWVGSDAAIQGVRPTYYYNYTDSITIRRRLQIVKEWLQLPEDRRPHLITFYFPQIDQASHRFGPYSRETEQAVRLIDESIGELVSITDSLHLSVNYLIVSDHGMAAVDTEHPIPIPPPLLDTATCRLATGSTLLHVYLKDKRQINPVFLQLSKVSSDFDVYAASNVPSAWHYSKQDDRFNRIGDLILVARFPKVFRISTSKITPGKHGYDPAMEEMHATFLARGPQIKSNYSIPSFENVHVFPLIAALLGLKSPIHIDGNPKVLRPILK